MITRDMFTLDIKHNKNAISATMSNQREFCRSMLRRHQLQEEKSKEDDSSEPCSLSTTESTHTKNKMILDETNKELYKELKKERISTCITQRWYVDVKIPESTTAGEDN